MHGGRAREEELVGIQAEDPGATKRRGQGHRQLRIQHLPRRDVRPQQGLQLPEGGARGPLLLQQRLPPDPHEHPLPRKLARGCQRGLVQGVVDEKHNPMEAFPEVVPHETLQRHCTVVRRFFEAHRGDDQRCRRWWWPINAVRARRGQSHRRGRAFEGRAGQAAEERRRQIPVHVLAQPARLSPTQQLPKWHVAVREPDCLGAAAASAAIAAATRLALPSLEVEDVQLQSLLLLLLPPGRARPHKGQRPAPAQGPGRGAKADLLCEMPHRALLQAEIGVGAAGEHIQLPSCLAQQHLTTTCLRAPRQHHATHGLPTTPHRHRSHAEQRRRAQG
mmetsp:Transcript_95033/g.307539  ORF Transcript_95033/g.307539 Transcript_95033/m.307539 type:complete len:333 (+) Transcript_95033:768-1766(+)